MAVVARGVALEGVDARPVEVEVDLLRRLPSVVIVGMANSAVKESAERIRSAMESSGYSFPRKRVVINLAPADLRKQGTALDLPTALGILAADGHLPVERLSSVICAGELALGGQLRRVTGALSMALLARREGADLLLPASSAHQAALVPGVRVVPVDTLAQAVEWLRGELTDPPLPRYRPTSPRHPVDLAEVRGQPVARKALEVAAAGAHHLLMLGPPGCGKSMLARRLPTILPQMSFDEALEATQVHAAADLGQSEGLLTERPFRAPHHTVTAAAMAGDRTLRPGELSLAHHGVLFLDEAPEFGRGVLEVLRQPLEEGEVRVSRAAGTVRFPAQLTLVMAANPCPCGLRGLADTPCNCTDAMVHRYLGKLSGPILDRIDLHLHLQPVTPRQLLFGPPGESSTCVRDRVLEARARQHARGQSVPNGQLPDAELSRIAALTDGARDLVASMADHHGLSARAATRLIRVARTVADLSGSEAVDEVAVNEAQVWRAVTTP